MLNDPQPLFENNDLGFEDFTDEYEDKKHLIAFDGDEDEDDDEDKDEDFESFESFQNAPIARKENEDIDIKKTIINFQEHFENFVKDFKKKGNPDKNENSEESSSDEDAVENPVEKKPTKAEIKFQEIIERARVDAQTEYDQIIKNARIEAEKIKEEAEKMGYADGIKKGYDQALEESSIEFNQRSREILERLEDDVNKINKQKDMIVSQQLDELRDLAIAIAEKVVKVSLKSSGVIIEKMIVSAIEKSKITQWAKLYISQVDWDFAIKSDAQILNSLKKITDTVKIEILENEESGKLIIEFPDQIIDASVNTQLEKIRALLENKS